eukprot:2694200-Pyramimonas_sp.AAC.1
MSRVYVRQVRRDLLALVNDEIKTAPGTDRAPLRVLLQRALKAESQSKQLKYALVLTRTKRLMEKHLKAAVLIARR